MSLDHDAARQLVSETVRSPDFRRATFGGSVRGQAASRWVRVVLRPVELRGRRYVQFSYFDRKKHISKNFADSEIDVPLNELLDLGFAGIHLSTGSEEIDIRTTKKGVVRIGRRKVDGTVAAPEPHNRAKDVPLPEGRADRLLEVMGIATAAGRVRPSMRAKFTQINEFLKNLMHVFGDAGLGSLGRPVEILDCGCGSSHLTIAAHHYLNDVLAIPVRIIGVDVNEEVIRKSMAKVERLGAGRLSFACGRIGGVETRPDIVIALHACDTATDDAIAQAVTTGAKLFLGVPCCHHHLNDAIGAEGPAAVLRPILRHGILHERTADLVTDAFRALALRIMGYRTDVVEFVSPEHTTRNLMIRAVRGLPVGEAAFVNEYREMRRFWGATPYIETVLGNRFQTVVS